MEHYLGEKLKKLRESRGWTQADLAKRLNKAVSTISGYESDAHAILESGFHSVDVHVVAAGKHFLRAIIVKILISFHLNGSFNDLIVDFLTK